MDRFDCYSKTQYCACVLYVTLSRQRAEATTPKSTIFNESSTLMYSAITEPNPAIFSQIAPKLVRILHDKNYQNWFSHFGEICIVLILRKLIVTVCGATTHTMKQLAGAY